MDTKFKPGDVVKLKSGGPPMTIMRESGNRPGQWLCKWIFNGEAKESAFMPDSLVATTPDAPDLDPNKA